MAGCCAVDAIVHTTNKDGCYDTFENESQNETLKPKPK